MIQPPYTTGTARVTQGSAVVTGTNTSWVLGLVNGGLFTFTGVAIPIASVQSDTQLTLTYPWPYGSNSGAYAIDLGRADAASAIVANRRLSEFLTEIAAISPFGLQLTGAANSAAARVAMELGNVANKSEAQMVQAGAIATALASKAGASLPITNANNAALGSFSHFIGPNADAVSANLPSLPGNHSRYWSILTFGLANRTVQYATEVFGIGTVRGRTFIRTRHDDAWSAWEEVLTRSNIVGTASAGAIVEQGQNANGIYTRFAGGFQICRSPVLSLTFVSANRLATSWSYPAPFAGSFSSAFILTDLGNLTSAMFSSSLQTIDNTSVSGARYSLIGSGGNAAFASGTSAGARVMAYGEWS